MTAITISGLTKKFGSTIAVDAVDFTIHSGELFFLLGPSGCGKTTLLRMIAGFIEPSSGSILFDQKNVTHLPPNRRNAGMVFQSYALWPHMTVEQNVAYGLSVRRVAASQKSRRVLEALKSVHMEEYATRKPNQLSGGQQQRVALARALVIEPSVLLLDEPLSNLDAKLRLEMRSEIRRICKQTGITTVYVTHDQKEALSMADSMAVLRSGKVMQIGPPSQMYRRPHSKFVADFLGETNFLTAEISRSSPTETTLRSPIGVLVSTAVPSATSESRSVTVSIRPESWIVVNELKATEQTATPNLFAGKRLRSTYLGEIAQHFVELRDGQTVMVSELNPKVDRSGIVEITISVSPHDVVVLAE
jgi:iron(III) transport system ATP-binding protein